MNEQQNRNTATRKHKSVLNKIDNVVLFYHNSRIICFKLILDVVDFKYFYRKVSIFSLYPSFAFKLWSPGRYSIITDTILICAEVRIRMFRKLLYIRKYCLEKYTQRWFMQLEKPLISPFGVRRSESLIEHIFDLQETVSVTVQVL